MRLLAFDSSTDILSIAVRRDTQLWQCTLPGGAQASAVLLAAVTQGLDALHLQWSDMKAIVFGNGPGAFTGLRTACAVAQGLAFGSGLPVLPVNSLLAVAEEARYRYGTADALAVTDARMGEVYHQRWQCLNPATAPTDSSTSAAPGITTDITCEPTDTAAPLTGRITAWPPGEAPQWRAVTAVALGDPAQVLPPSDMCVAGNAHATYPQLAPQCTHYAALPTATALLRLAPSLIAQGMLCPPEDALPHYVRDKVAQTTAEREAARQATTGR